MVKLWVKKNTKDFDGAEWCWVCGRHDINLIAEPGGDKMPFNMCTGGNDGQGRTHPPVAMQRVHQWGRKGFNPRPNRLHPTAHIR